MSESLFSVGDCVFLRSQRTGPDRYVRVVRVVPPTEPVLFHMNEVKKDNPAFYYRSKIDEHSWKRETSYICHKVGCSGAGIELLWCRQGWMSREPWGIREKDKADLLSDPVKPLSQTEASPSILPIEDALFPTEVPEDVVVPGVPVPVHSSILPPEEDDEDFFKSDDSSAIRKLIDRKGREFTRVLFRNTVRVKRIDFYPELGLKWTFAKDKPT